MLPLTETRLTETRLTETKVDSGLLRARALRCLGELPPFSPILNRLLASLAKEDVSFNKLGDLIEKDPVMTGNLLHLVNSALYARRGSINSVRHALSLLGINKLRNAVLGMSITRMWNQVRTPPTWSMARFNMHSSASAILSDLLSQRLGVDYPEGAFVAGLLHDVGRLMIALGLTEEYGRILQMHESGRPLLECEFEVTGFTHPELSAEALAHWNLPEPIQNAVRFHHTPDLDLTVVAPGGVALSRVLDAANQYVNSTGVSILKTCPDAADATLIHSLGLPAEQLERILVDFKPSTTQCPRSSARTGGASFSFGLLNDLFRITKASLNSHHRASGSRLFEAPCDAPALARFRNYYRPYKRAVSGLPYLALVAHTSTCAASTFESTSGCPPHHIGLRNLRKWSSRSTRDNVCMRDRLMKVLQKVTTEPLNIGDEIRCLRADSRFLRSAGSGERPRNRVFFQSAGWRSASAQIRFHSAHRSVSFRTCESMTYIHASGLTYRIVWSPTRNWHRAWAALRSGLRASPVFASAVGGEETVADLAIRAARDCLENAGIEASQIGLIIVSSGSSERRFPGPASTVASALGLNATPAIDLPIASAGSIFGLSLASQLAEAYGNVLVIAAEKMSAVIQVAALDQNTAILFGDGAGAALVSSRPGRFEVLDSVLHTDGAFRDDLALDWDSPLHMKGLTVILQAARKLPAVIEEVLKRQTSRPKTWRSS